MPTTVEVYVTTVNTMRPRQNRRQFPDAIFKCIFLNQTFWIPIKISMKFVPKSPLNNIPALVQIMAWRRPGDKPLSEPMMFGLLTLICVTRPLGIERQRHLCPLLLGAKPLWHRGKWDSGSASKGDPRPWHRPTNDCPLFRFEATGELLHSTGGPN